MVRGKMENGLLTKCLQYCIFPDMDFGSKAWHNGTFTWKGLLGEMETDKKFSGHTLVPVSFKSMASPQIHADLSSLNSKQYFSDWMSSVHLICLNFHLLLLRELDHCLLPKWPRKEKYCNKLNSNELSKIVTHPPGYYSIWEAECWTHPLHEARLSGNSISDFTQLKDGPVH